jgi:hypothetical protein
MGFVPLRSPKSSFRVKIISDILPGGGNIPLIEVYVSRCYPQLFLEKCRDNNNEPPVLTQAEEDVRRREFEKRKLKVIEKISESIECELEKVSVGKSACVYWH